MTYSLTLVVTISAAGPDLSSFDDNLDMVQTGNAVRTGRRVVGTGYRTTEETTSRLELELLKQAIQANFRNNSKEGRNALPYYWRSVEINSFIHPSNFPTSGQNFSGSGSPGGTLSSGRYE